MTIYSNRLLREKRSVKFAPIIPSPSGKKDMNGVTGVLN
jgi:hypothetical protein